MERTFLMFRAGAAAFAILLSFSVDAMAQAPSQRPAPLPNPFTELMRGTPEEQAACRPDANKHCRDAEPDPMRVLGCLQQNRTKLSKPCLKVLESHGQ
jgi:hypothetical protein